MRLRSRGKGGADCGTWVKVRTENRSALLEANFLGLLNGLAVGVDVEFWHAGGTDLTPEAVFLWLDGWCRQNPLNNMVVGKFVLYEAPDKASSAPS